MTELLRNLHVPLPAGWYESLRAEARRLGRPATQLAREAIGAWLEERHRRKLEQQLARYIADYAGSDQDLDEDLEREAAREMARTAPAARRSRRKR